MLGCESWALAGHHARAHPTPCSPPDCVLGSSGLGPPMGPVSPIPFQPSPLHHSWPWVAEPLPSSGPSIQMELHSQISISLMLVVPVRPAHTELSTGYYCYFLVV